VRDRRLGYRVVATGIVNSGKSALLSALAGQTGLFPSADVPGCTAKVTTEPVGPWLLVDTPGLDGPGNPLPEVLGEVRKADTVLWCHSLRQGELRPGELAALAQMRLATAWRTCFVLTHADDPPDPDRQAIVSGRMAAQLAEAFGLAMSPAGLMGRDPGIGPRRCLRPFDIVGVKAYWLAHSRSGEARAALLACSGIPRLRRFLDHLAAGHGPRSDARPPATSEVLA